MKKDNEYYNYWDEQFKKEHDREISYKVLNPLISEETFNLFVNRFNETWYDGFDVLSDSDYDISIYTSNLSADSEDFNFIVVSVDKYDGLFSYKHYVNYHGEIEGFVLNDIIYNWGTFMFIYLQEQTKFTRLNGITLNYTPNIFNL